MKAPLGLTLTAGLAALAAPLHAAPESSPAAVAASPADVSVLKRLSLEDLMNTQVTTVSRSESTLGESPAAVFVITPEMIRRSGAREIPELLRMVPGIHVARIDGNKWAVGARGFGNRFTNKLLVQMDGRTLYNPAFSGVFWDTVDYPMEDIERIEVVRGPGASVWGANAVNGVINIITKSARDAQGGYVSGGGGAEDGGFGTFRFSGKLGDNLHYRVHGKGFDRAKQFSLQGDPNDEWRGASTGLSLDWAPAEGDHVTFDAGYLRSEAGRLDGRPITVAPFQRMYAETEVTDAAHVLARWTRTLGPESNWSLQVYWDHYARASSGGINDSRFDTFEVDFQHQFPMSARQKIVWGLGYRFADAFLSDSAPDAGFILSYDRNHRRLHLFSAFVQDEIAVVRDRLSLTLGSKFEHNDYTGLEVQPAAKLLWTPTPRQSVWASASRAVRMANVSEDEINLTLLPLAPGVFPRVVHNRDFDSEEVLAYEIGYRVQAAEAFSLDLALFYNDYERLGGTVFTPSRAPAPPPFIVPLALDNVLQGETYGVEVSARWQIADWWWIRGSYTWLQMNLHRDQGQPASAEVAEGQTPRNQVQVQSSWNLPGNVELDLIGRYVDQLSGFNPSGAPGVSDTVDAYFSLDARIAWRLRDDVEIAIVGRNLLDNHHPEFGTNAFIRNPLVEIERSVYGMITWRF